MNFVALEEVISLNLMKRYLEDITGLTCQIFSVSSTPILSVGDISKLPQLTPSLIKSISATTKPLLLERALGGTIFIRQEPVGYALVAVETNTDLAAAQFVFELLNDMANLRILMEDKEFDASYSKNLLSLMQKMSQKLALFFDSKKAAEFFISECQKIFAVKSAALLTVVEKSLKILAAVDMDFHDYDIANYIVYSQKGIICNDVTHDSRFTFMDKDGKQVQSTHKNVLAIPIFDTDRVIGVVYLADKETGPFHLDDQRMLQTLSTSLGNAIANIELHKNVVKHERIKSNLERYLSPNLVKEVIETGGYQILGGQRMQVAIFFSDIRGFTKLAEVYSPEQLVAQLNEYFEDMSNILFNYEGTLDKFVGDLLMVLFGAPKPMAPLEACKRAINMAIDMQKHLFILNKKWTAEGRKPFGVGMGINVGDVVFGNIGSSRAMGLTVIGDNVNQAQRLEAYAKAGEILITESVYKLTANEGFQTEKLGRIEIKGKEIDAYRIKYEEN